MAIIFTEAVTMEQTCGQTSHSLLANNSQQRNLVLIPDEQALLSKHVALHVGPRLCLRMKALC